MSSPWDLEGSDENELNQGLYDTPRPAAQAEFKHDVTAIAHVAWLYSLEVRQVHAGWTSVTASEKRSSTPAREGEGMRSSGATPSC